MSPECPTWLAPFTTDLNADAAFACLRPVMSFTVQETVVPGPRTYVFREDIRDH